MSGPASRRSWPRLALGTIMIIVAGAAFFRGVHRPAPSLVLITVSGLRADAVTTESAPALSGLTRRDVSALVPSTVGSLATLMTGRSLEETGARADDTTRLPASVEPLGERLARAGHRTAAFVGEGRIARTSGLYRGFERALVPSSPFDQAVLPDEMDRLRLINAGSFKSSDIVGAFNAHVRALQPGTRSFLWLHFGEPTLGARTALGDPQAYGSAVRAVDEAVARVLSTMQTSGLAGSFVLVVASLHGEGLGAEGEALHGLTLSEEVMTVPVFSSDPRLVEGDPLATLADLHPRILRALGEKSIEDVPAAALRATWAPSRFYGWPDRAEFLEEGRWEPLPTAARAALGLSEWAPEPTREVREAVLAAMTEATSLALGERISDAIAALERAHALAPDAPAPVVFAVQLVQSLPTRERAAMLDRLKPAIDRLAALAAERDDPSFLIDAGRSLLAAEREAEARAIADRLARMADLTPGLRLAVADLLDRAGDPERATEIAAALANEDGPERGADLEEWIGDRLRRTENAYRARQAYERAGQAPAQRSANLLAKLADVYSILGENERALQTYAEAARLEPGYRYPHLRAGEVLLEMEQAGAAAHAFVQSVKPTSTEVEAALLRARLLESHGLLGAAATELARFAQEGDGPPPIEVAFARILATLGDPSRARAHLEKLLSRNPAHDPARVQLSRALALAGDEAGALRELEKVSPSAGPQLANTIATDAAFRRFGEGSALAAKARTFVRADPRAGTEAPADVW